MIEARYSLISVNNRGIKTELILPGFGNGNRVRGNGLFEARDVDDLTCAFYLTYDRRDGAVVRLRRLPRDQREPKVFRFTAEGISDGIVTPLEGQYASYNNGYIIRDMTDVVCFNEEQPINKVVRDPLALQRMKDVLTATTDMIIMAVDNASLVGAR